ncbi:MAG: hypothetical protein ACRBI6_14520 [Acidimicrobiales bacterium]
MTFRIGYLAVRYPAFGAVLAALLAALTSYGWHVGRSDPGEPGVSGGLPLVLWAGAAGFTGAAIYRRDPVRFSRPLDESSFAPIPADADVVSVARIGEAGGAKLIIFVVSNGQFRVWKLRAGRGLRVQRALDAGRVPGHDPRPVLDLPVGSVQRMVRITESTLVIVHTDAGGDQTLTTVDVFADAGQVLTELSAAGWSAATDHESDDLRRWKQRRGGWLGLAAGAVAAAVAAAVLLPSWWAAGVAIVILVVVQGGAQLIARSGSRRADLVVPPHR